MKVQKRRDQLEAAGAEAAFVVHDEPETVRATMLADLDVDVPVLVDLERRAYADWGLGRASAMTIFADFKVWRQYARMLLAGERLRAGGRDPLQLGGDFVVDGRGEIVYARPQRKDDRPPVGVLLDAVETAAKR